MKTTRMDPEHVADAWHFNSLVVVFIIVDAVIVGIESDTVFDDDFQDRIGYWAADLLIAIFFLAEMAVRIHHQGWHYFGNSWNLFDYTCATLGCTAVIQPTQLGGSSQDATNARVMKALKGFRVFRLLRVVRVLMGLKVVEGLWVLVSGLLASFRTLFWVGIFSLVMLYMFGCIIVVSMDSDMVYEHWPDHDLYFGSVFKGMLSVWQIATFDHWIDIARPLAEYNPTACVAVFLAILVCTFGVLNVVLSVMVESVRNIMQMNLSGVQIKLEETERNLMLLMERDFNDKNIDDDGRLEYKDFRMLLKDETFALKMRLWGVQYHEAKSLFHILDAEKRNRISWAEFRKGMRMLRGSAQGRDLVRIINFAQDARIKAMRYVTRVRRMAQEADRMQAILNDVGRGIVKQLDIAKESSSNNSAIREHAKSRQRAIRKLKYEAQVAFPESTG